MDCDISPLTPEDIPAFAALCIRALQYDSLAPEDLAHGIFNDPCADPRWTLAAKAGGELVGVLNGALRPPPDQPSAGLIKLFAVDPTHQRQGVATRLLGRFEELCRAEGAARIRVGSIGHLYFFGGVDPRYTAGVRFLTRHGYSKTGDAFYLAVDLRKNLPRYDGLVDDLAEAGVTFHRPVQGEKAEVQEWIRTAFGEGWAHETGLAFRHSPSTVWVARSSGQVCGFAASNATGRDYVGPTGVGPDFRRRGIGRVLVVRCLGDMQADGRPVAWIPTGFGRIAYYNRAAGAEVGRLFWPFEKQLLPSTEALR